MGKSSRERNVSVIKDANGNNIVVINDIIFKGKRSIDWDYVEEYLKDHVGDVYKNAEINDVVYFGKDLPDEYAHSEYSNSLKGAYAKAKANAAQGLGEMIEIAFNGCYTENKKRKHAIDAAKGWYRFESRFALPVYEDNGEIERYNVFHIYLIIRHDQNGKKYLYDLINIKKETSNPLGCR
ncbi:MULTISPECIES: hypothetical protein [Butyrivibrio]|uniref:hypothetical protein n=1 Tax=Butyrivibrio TaxID=830 RepID=UPI000557A456|nr:MULTISPECIES: hypothetical protein [Butyrivibrio]